MSLEIEVLPFFLFCGQKWDALTAWTGIRGSAEEGTITLSGVSAGWAGPNVLTLVE